MKFGKIPLLALFISAIFVFGCSTDKISPDKIDYLPKQDIKPIEKPEPLSEEHTEGVEVSKRNYISGEWMAYSKGVYYDDGDFRYPETPGTMLLINEDKTWDYSSFKGKWEVSPVTEDDWSIWGIISYGPAKKLTLYGWNDDIASGPIEGEGTPQFIWVIYRAGPPFEKAASQVQMKFGWT